MNADLAHLAFDLGWFLVGAGLYSFVRILLTCTSADTPPAPCAQPPAGQSVPGGEAGFFGWGNGAGI